MSRMDTEFDELEQLITSEMKQIYTDAVIDHAMNPRNVGSIAGADGFASVTGPCGDNMEIWLKVKDGRVDSIAFWTDGCGTSIACGSMVTELVKGKNIVWALGINQSQVLEALGGLPEDSLHCALLAANTLNAAIQDYLALKKEPWKRAYRKR